MRHVRTLLAAIALMLVLSACNFPLRAPIAPAQPATESDIAVPAASPNVLPPAVEYNLGDATVTQARFPEDSRFHNMPVRLNGVIAAPTEGDGPFPVVVIFHGTHPGCPTPDGGEVDVWPCAPEDEQRNYYGFSYLASELAAHGYIALSMNINAENTFGFGEGTPGERLRQIVDLQLKALQTANEGGDNPFGVDLAGRVDLERLALFGHSRGGESAYGLSEDLEFNPAGADVDPTDGPVDGILMIAPATVFIDPAPGSRAPLAILLLRVMATSFPKMANITLKPAGSPQIRRPG
ncbi:MAG: hypothetical protein IPK16_08765 [Anaerolineales bacterium]|nr:hypothetical protein [Anaerolineales bacterium]